MHIEAGIGLNWSLLIRSQTVTHLIITMAALPTLPVMCKAVKKSEKHKMQQLKKKPVKGQNDNVLLGNTQRIKRILISLLNKLQKCP